MLMQNDLLQYVSCMLKSCMPAHVKLLHSGLPGGQDVLPCWQALQLYLQLMSILATLNVSWPPVMGRLFSACGYVTNLTPKVSKL